MRLATQGDIPFWFTLDKHIAREELERKIGGDYCYIIEDEGTPVGIFRYGLFWDVIPFLNLIVLVASRRGKGIGRLAMEQWESKMKERGHKMVMTSTQSDERAQFFYRQLGYRDSGCLILDTPPYEQPLEIILTKAL